MSDPLFAHGVGLAVIVIVVVKVVVAFAALCCSGLLRLLEHFVAAGTSGVA